MTTIILDVAFLDLLIRIAASAGFGFLIFTALQMVISMCEDRKKRNRKNEATVIYNRRKRQFDYEENEKAWKKWKHMNVEICDLVEGGTYY